MIHQQFDPHDWTVVQSEEDLERSAEAIASGSGPIGVDVERASGYRYFPRAYLIQVNRRGAGTFVIDPVALPDLTLLNEAMQGEEWILHAAIADLDSLRDRGLQPSQIFDTELAARILGFDRVNLAAVVHELLGIELPKSHSAANWSVRPLPESWIAYAAADVAFLPELRDRLDALLTDERKISFAHEEFAAVLNRMPPPTPEEPWRKISRLASLRDPRTLAVARELWYARDALARERDLAPGRILPDASIIVAAKHMPRSAGELARNREFRGKESRTELQRWWEAILRGKTTDNLPVVKVSRRDEIPHHRHWERKRPEAFQRLQRAKHALELESQRLHIPLENLLTPSVLRRVAWDPPEPVSAENIARRLRALGARPWQVNLTAQLIAASFVESP